MTYSQVYRLPDGAVRLRQGEIISNFPHIIVDTLATEETAPQLTINIHAFVALVTPDCDIETYERNLAQARGSTMNGFMILPLVARSELSNTQWSPAKSNSKSGQHVLEACKAEYDLTGEGLPALYADFRWMFTVPPEYLKAAVERGVAHRRTQLCSPYRDHLQVRLAAHLSRVALERDHDTA